MEPLLAISESDDDTQEVSPHNNACAAPQSDDDTPRVSEKSPQDNQTWTNLFENQVEKKSLATVPAYEEVISSSSERQSIEVGGKKFCTFLSSEIECTT